MINSIYINLLRYFISIVDLKNKLKIKNFFTKIYKKKEIVIFDIGAHRGETINFFLKSFQIKKIFAFEPNYDVYSTINKKFAKDKKIEIYNIGLGDNEYEKNLKVFNESSSSTFTQLNKDSKYFKRKNKILNFFLKEEDQIQNKMVKVISLNKFIKEKNIENIDILKIDTEGFEFKILKGLSNDDFLKINFIYFEHHYDLMLEKNYTYSQIKELLEKHNFVKVYKIKMSFRKTFEYIYENKRF